MRRSAPRIALTLLAIVIAAVLAWRALENDPEPALSRKPSVESPAAPATTPTPGAITAPSNGPTTRAPAADGVSNRPASDAAQLRVRVVSAEGGLPVARAHVQTKSPDGSVPSSPRTAETGDDGWCEVLVEPAVPWVVTARSRPDQAAAQTADLAPLARGEVREVHLTVSTRDALALAVRVLDRETQTPIAGARIGLADGMRLVSADQTVLTDHAGLAGVPIDAWGAPLHHPNLAVRADGYEAAVFLPAMLAESSPCEILLSRTATLRARVLDSSGAPVAGATVEVLTEAYRFARPEGSFVSVGLDWGLRATTGGDGIAELGDLPPRMPLRAAARDGRTLLWQPREPIVLEPGEVRAETWHVGSGARISGLVLEADGSIAPGVEVWLLPAWNPGDQNLEPEDVDGLRKSRSDARGRFEFTGVDVGSWRIGPRPSGGRVSPTNVRPDEIAPTGKHVQVPAGVREVEIEVRLYRGLSIHGRVVGPDGAPVTTAVVSARSVAGGFSSRVDVDFLDGSFVVGPLVPGEHELSADGVQGLVCPEPVRAAPGARDVLLRMQRGAAIRGRVEDARTRAGCAAQLMLTPHRPMDWFARIQDADASGEFEFSELHAGTYDVSASTADGRAGVLRGVAVGEGQGLEGLRLELRSGAKLCLAFRGQQAVAHAQIFVDDTLVGADGIERGTERVFVVPPGEVVVRLDLETASPALTRLAVVAGESRTLVYDDGWR